MSSKTKRSHFYVVLSTGREHIYGAFYERKEAIKYKEKLEKQYKEKFRVVRK